MNSARNINKRYSDDLYLTFLIKKVEKIVSALYLITNNLDKKEPLRWGIRQKGVVLLSETIKLNNNLDLDKTKNFSNISFRLFEVMSLLELAVDTGLLLEENFEVFKRELDLLLSVIKNNAFEITKQFSPKIEGKDFQIKDKSFRTKEIKSVLETIKNTSVYKGQNNLKRIKDMSIRGEKENIGAKKTPTRRNEIIKILSKGQKLTIKDISKGVTNCGEKTIQRELRKMMEDKLLIKEGERRWSRYFLVNKID